MDILSNSFLIEQSERFGGKCLPMAGMPREDKEEFIRQALYTTSLQVEDAVIKVLLGKGQLLLMLNRGKQSPAYAFEMMRDLIEKEIGSLLDDDIYEFNEMQEEARKEPARPDSDFV